MSKLDQLDSIESILKQWSMCFSSRQLKSICRALYHHHDDIPEDRKAKLRQQLQELCPEQNDFSDEFLKANINIETS